MPTYKYIVNISIIIFLFNTAENAKSKYYCRKIGRKKYANLYLKIKAKISLNTTQKKQ